MVWPESPDPTLRDLLGRLAEFAPRTAAAPASVLTDSRHRLATMQLRNVSVSGMDPRSVASLIAGSGGSR